MQIQNCTKKYSKFKAKLLLLLNYLTGIYCTASASTIQICFHDKMLQSVTCLGMQTELHHEEFVVNMLAVTSAQQNVSHRSVQIKFMAI